MNKYAIICRMNQCGLDRGLRIDYVVASTPQEALDNFRQSTKNNRFRYRLLDVTLVLKGDWK